MKKSFGFGCARLLVGTVPGQSILDVKIATILCRDQEYFGKVHELNKK